MAIVLMLFFVVCGLSWMAIYESSSYQKCSAEASCQSSTEHQRQEKVVPIIDRIRIVVRCSAQSIAENNPVVSAVATVVIAVFTTILGLFTISLSRSTRLAAHAAVAAELPIVRPEGFRLLEVTSTATGEACFSIRPNNVPSRMSATFGLRNVGRTAAEITSVCMDWQVCAGLPPIPQYKTILPFSPGVFIAANSILDAGPQQYFIELTAEQIKTLNERSAYLWIYGFVTYLDFLQRKDEARFCTKYLFSQEGPGAITGFVFDSETPAAYTQKPNNSKAGLSEPP